MIRVPDRVSTWYCRHRVENVIDTPMISLTTTAAPLDLTRQIASGGYGPGPAIGLGPIGRGWIEMQSLSNSIDIASIRAA
ncbi:hypothetical protein [Halostagnicola kamekurae]|uniref:Uncharacterized protein n=1 Tax=Halostagnicola kamekurae TaxID=619731 RepID=A0A1I6UHZ7_9EURY|nr:hypothetical protein [Halostagnicola kamekurae]SFT01038.1 hypothetical protein SAMN04488556_3888 [Halostagnicola kamekurae]